MSRTRDRIKRQKRIDWYDHKRKVQKFVGTSIQLVDIPDRLRRALTVPLYCPGCTKRHIDEGSFAQTPHKTHRCVDDAAGAGCGREWESEGIRIGAPA